VKFPDGLPPTTIGNLAQLHVLFTPGADPTQVVAVHPTQVYETALMLLATAWLWKRRDHPHAMGWLFGCYLVIAGVERLLIEFVRAKDDRVLHGFTIAQAASLGLIAVGAVVMARLKQPSAVSPQPAALMKKQAAATSPADG
jgi:phosphatidylglycerol:prolipoprotein diacylglycerol transferase